VSGLLQAVDRDELGALILLDIMAALDTVDHEILMQRMQQTFVVGSNAILWF